MASERDPFVALRGCALGSTLRALQRWPKQAAPKAAMSLPAESRLPMRRSAHLRSLAPNGEAQPKSKQQ
jgi:hypothetical protein